MPNVENIKKAIQVMERVKKNEEELDRKLFDHQRFQSNLTSFNQPVLRTETEVLGHCGTVCCFAGWLGVSPEFTEMGYCFDQYSVPGIDEERDETDLLKELLGLDDKVIDGLVYNIGMSDDFGEDYYGKPSKDVTVDDVIEKLKSFIGEE